MWPKVLGIKCFGGYVGMRHMPFELEALWISN